MPPLPQSKSSSTLTADQLRQAYLDFFAKKDHVILPSSLLVPENDPTTLFTTAGMQPMMPYLLGKTHPKGKKLADSQKCFRAQDIEEVGDNRHTTFFEMLGNWSLGDYFKREQLSWFFEFLVEVVGLDPQKLYVTVFAGNDKYGIKPDLESAAIWQELFTRYQVEAEIVKNPQEINLDDNKNARIFFYPADKNWWSRSGTPEQMPSGEPGGPDSEVFYDFGQENLFHENSPFADQPCHVNCECGRFLEIGNSVFMQYLKTADGFSELPKKNIDFGGGLERILAAAHHQPDLFQTELFWPIIRKIEAITNTTYQDHQQQYRIIADHLKAAVMLIGDGVLPDNKDQGYIARRLLRRAMRQTRLFSTQENILPSLVEMVAQIYQQPYPDLIENKEKITQVIAQESSKFERTLAKGLREFEKLIQTKQVLTGETAYHLYETYGFPLEILLEEARMRELRQAPNLEEDFQAARHVHIQASKIGSEQKFKGGLADHSQRTTAFHTATHLLHQAIRQVLGEQVEQKGSNITADRLRFDFSFARALTQNEIEQVEQLVNDWIQQDLPVCKVTMPKEQALLSGVLAYFAERYPAQVDVYLIGEVGKIDQTELQALPNHPKLISKELCGGPHVNSTGEIGLIKIFKEKSAAQGVRRVYAKVREY